MDRNLGVSNMDSSSVDFRGLIYEWRRKDPFFGARNINQNALKQFYQMNGNNYAAIGGDIVGMLDIGTFGYYGTANPSGEVLQFSDAVQGGVNFPTVYKTYGCSVRPVRVP